MLYVFLRFFSQSEKDENGVIRMLQAIKEVFTKRYQEDVEYLELKYEMRSYVKLKNKSESIDEKVARLKECGYSSNCRIKVGGF